MCSCGRGDDPARRPRRVLRVGRAAGRPAPARAAGHRRRRRRAGGQLRGEGVRRAHGDGRCAGAAALPGGGRRAAAHGRLLGGEQGRLPRLRGRLAARRGAVDRRGVPRRPRDGADRRVRRPRSRCGCGATSASGSGCRSRSASRGRSSWPRSRAASRSRTGSCSVPPDRELAFLHPLPVERLWGVGAVTAAKLHERGIAHRRAGRAPAESRLVVDPRPRAGRHLHALAHNRDPRPVQARRRRGSIGSQRARGRRPLRRRGRRRGRSSRSSTASPRRLRAAGRVGRTVVLRLRFADFTRATRSHTLPRATASTHTILARPARSSPRRMPLIEQRRAHARRHRGRQPRPTQTRSSSSLPFDGRDDDALDAAARRGARPLRLDVRHPRRPSRPRPGASRAAAPRLMPTMRFGLIGTGYWADAVHAAGIAAHPRASSPASGAATRPRRRRSPRSTAAAPSTRSTR